MERYNIYDIDDSKLLRIILDNLNYEQLEDLSMKLALKNYNLKEILAKLEEE